MRVRVSVQICMDFVCTPMMHSGTERHARRPENPQTAGLYAMQPSESHDRRTRDGYQVFQAGDFLTCGAACLEHISLRRGRYRLGPVALSLSPDLTRASGNSFTLSGLQKRDIDY